MKKYDFLVTIHFSVNLREKMFCVLSNAALGRQMKRIRKTCMLLSRYFPLNLFRVLFYYVLSLKRFWISPALGVKRFRNASLHPPFEELPIDSTLWDGGIKGGKRVKCLRERERKIQNETKAEKQMRTLKALEKYSLAYWLLNKPCIMYTY